MPFNKKSSLIPFFLFLLVAMFMLAGVLKSKSNMPFVNKDKPLPTFQLPQLYDNTKILDNSIIEDQVAMIHVYATWCSVCKQTHGELVNIAKISQIPIVGIAYRSDLTEAKAFLQQYGDPYDFIGFDLDGQFGVDMGI